MLFTLNDDQCRLDENGRCGCLKFIKRDVDLEISEKDPFCSWPRRLSDDEAALASKLFKAVENNDTEKVKQLLGKYQTSSNHFNSILNVRRTTEDTEDFLTAVAASYGDESMIEFLYSHGCCLNLQTTSGASALHFATRFHRVKCLKMLLLLDQDVFINFRPRQGDYLVDEVLLDLVHAMRQGEMKESKQEEDLLEIQEIAAMLLKNGACVTKSVLCDTMIFSGSFIAILEEELEAAHVSIAVPKNEFNCHKDASVPKPKNEFNCYENIVIPKHKFSCSELAVTIPDLPPSIHLSPETEVHITDSGSPRKRYSTKHRYLTSPTAEVSEPKQLPIMPRHSPVRNSPKRPLLSPRN